jgi:hypothetical protein
VVTPVNLPIYSIRNLYTQPLSYGSLKERRRENDFAGTVCIPDYYADALQAWFHSINATCAVSRVMKPLTKFHWALSKLPTTLVDTIGLLCHNHSIIDDPYTELQHIVLHSYSLSEHQRIIKCLDHPGLGANKPSVLVDQLNALKPTSVEEIQKGPFLRKMPAPRDFTNLPALTERCYEIGRTEARISVRQEASPPQQCLSNQQKTQTTIFVFSQIQAHRCPSCRMSPKNRPQIRTWSGPMAKLSQPEVRV